MGFQYGDSMIWPTWQLVKSEPGAYAGYKNSLDVSTKHWLAAELVETTGVDVLKSNGRQFEDARAYAASASPDELTVSRQQDIPTVTHLDCLEMEVARAEWDIRGMEEHIVRTERLPRPEEGIEGCRAYIEERQAARAEYLKAAAKLRQWDR